MQIIIVVYLFLLIHHSLRCFTRLVRLVRSVAMPVAVVALVLLVSTSAVSRRHSSKVRQMQVGIIVDLFILFVDSSYFM
jgi:Mn2+/Fe2+ NRAMP family transporter